MKRNTLKILLTICVSVLAAELILAGLLYISDSKNPVVMQTNPTNPYFAETTAPAATDPTVSEGETLPSQATEPGTTEPAGTETTEATEATEPTETEPTEKVYTLTFVGACTLGSTIAQS